MDLASRIYHAGAEHKPDTRRPRGYPSGSISRRSAVPNEVGTAVSSSGDRMHVTRICICRVGKWRLPRVAWASPEIIAITSTRALASTGITTWRVPHRVGSESKCLRSCIRIASSTAGERHTVSNQATWVGTGGLDLIRPSRKDDCSVSTKSRVCTITSIRFGHSQCPLAQPVDRRL
jgi:hypothetical protein